jgi:hypothetical protein
MSVRNLALLLATAFSTPPMMPHSAQMSAGNADVVFASVTAQHANATRSARALLSLSAADRAWLDSLADTVAASINTFPINSVAPNPIGPFSSGIASCMIASPHSAASLSSSSTPTFTANSLGAASSLFADFSAPSSVAEAATGDTHLQQRLPQLQVQQHAPAHSLSLVSNCGAPPSTEPSSAPLPVPSTSAVPGHVRPAAIALPVVSDSMMASSAAVATIAPPGTFILPPAADGFEEAMIRELFLRSFQSPLTPQQLQSLIARVESDSALIQLAEAGGILPTKLPELVENNPMVAAAFVGISLRCRGDDSRSGSRSNTSASSSSASGIGGYLGVLLDTPLSLQLLDVVNRLISTSHVLAADCTGTGLSSAHSSPTKRSAPDSQSIPLVGVSPSASSSELLRADFCLPLDFVPQFVSRCIRCCDANKDRYLQARLVRLVCVFLQSLLRHRHPVASGVWRDSPTPASSSPSLSVASGDAGAGGLQAELQAFCVAHARVREAAALFRMLKLEVR